MLICLWCFQVVLRLLPINQSNADGAFIDLSDMTAKQIAQFWFGIDDTMLGFKSLISLRFIRTLLLSGTGSGLLPVST